jgi:DNA-binding MurR/RpiR family transcriptional regulator
LDSILFTIRECLPRLSRAERKAADYILAEPKKVVYCNIAELAKQSEVSQAAIVRFCRRIGVGGYSDFKIRLSHDVFRISADRYLPTQDLEREKDPAAVVRDVIGSIQRSMAWLESLSDIHLLSTAAELIGKARITAIFGVGASSLVAQDLYQKLLRIGIPCSAPLDTDLQITAACNLKEHDAAMIVSYSGETPAMLAAGEWAKKKGAAVITLTGEAPNTLRGYARVPLLVPSTEQVLRPGAMVSRISQLVVVDMLYSLLLAKNLNAAVQALEETLVATHAAQGLGRPERSPGL